MSFHTEHTSTVFFTRFRTNGGLCVVFICGKVDVCVDEDAKDKKERKVLSLLGKVKAMDKLDK